MKKLITYVWCEEQRRYVAPKPAEKPAPKKAPKAKKPKVAE